MRRILTALVVVCLAGCATAVSEPVVGADGVQHVRVDVAGGAVVGGATRYAVPLGSTVELVVASDVADQVHVHGYDRLAFVTAGATATLRFTADLPGVFDVELEQRSTRLAQLQVGS